MSKLGKRVKTLNENIDKNKSYTASEAVKVVKAIANAKFDETVEIAFRLGVDPKHADQNIRGAVVLPNGTGKTQKVLVVTKGDNIKAALDAGADFAGAEEMVEKIQKENWFEFDVIIATPDMMPILGRLGRVLGPKGLMPNPKTGTVTTDVSKAVNDVKSGKVEYRVDKEGNLHAIIGKVSFTEEALLENFKAIYDAILKAKPSTAKGTYFRNVAISSSMGPGLKVTSESLA